MTSPTDRLVQLDLTLPAPATATFNYVPVTRHGDLLFVSGQLPKVDGEVGITGVVDEEISLDRAREAARICTLQGLACIADELGSLDQVERVLRIVGYVASSPTFHDQPKVLDAASDLLGQVFEDAGGHARAAVGVAALPRRSPVEIEFTLAAKPTTRPTQG